MNKKISRNLSDPDSRAFWKSIEEAAQSAPKLDRERVPWKHEVSAAPAEKTPRPRPGRKQK
jgi:hypothetical protein